MNSIIFWQAGIGKHEPMRLRHLEAPSWALARDLFGFPIDSGSEAGMTGGREAGLTGAGMTKFFKTKNLFKND